MIGSKIDEDFSLFSEKYSIFVMKSIVVSNIFMAVVWNQKWFQEIFQQFPWFFFFVESCKDSKKLHSCQNNITKVSYKTSRKPEQKRWIWWCVTIFLPGGNGPHILLKKHRNVRFLAKFRWNTTSIQRQNIEKCNNQNPLTTSSSFFYKK